MAREGKWGTQAVNWVQLSVLPYTNPLATGDLLTLGGSNWLGLSYLPWVHDPELGFQFVHTTNSSLLGLEVFSGPI